MKFELLNVDVPEQGVLNNESRGESNKCSRCEVLLQAVKLSYSMSRMCSALGVGLILFDFNKKVFNVNAQAKALLKLPEDFLERGGDPLKVGFSKEDQSKLVDMITKMCTNKSTKSMELNVLLGGVEVAVMLERLEVMGNSGVSIFIFGTTSNIEQSVEELAQFFGLTKAESCLIGTLARGKTAKEYAAAKGISIHTVYSQIKSALAKTGVRRQSELVKLVLEFPANSGQRIRAHAH